MNWYIVVSAERNQAYIYIQIIIDLLYDMWIYWRRPLPLLLAYWARLVSVGRRPTRSGLTYTHAITINSLHVLPLVTSFLPFCWPVHSASATIGTRPLDTERRLQASCLATVYSHAPHLISCEPGWSGSPSSRELCWRSGRTILRVIKEAPTQTTLSSVSMVAIDLLPTDKT